MNKANARMGAKLPAHFANAVFDEDTGQMLDYKKLINICADEHNPNACLAFLWQKGLIVTPNNQALKIIFTCQEPYKRMVLLVGHAIPHNHETHLVDLLGGAHYVVYMLLLAGKHMIMPFSNTNWNMHIGGMLRFQNYGKLKNGVNKTFANFMSANMHQMLCPIQWQIAIRSSILRQLTFVRIHNIKRLAV